PAFSEPSLITPTIRSVTAWLTRTRFGADSASECRSIELSFKSVRSSTDGLLHHSDAISLWLSVEARVTIRTAYRFQRIVKRRDGESTPWSNNGARLGLPCPFVEHRSSLIQQPVNSNKRLRRAPVAPCGA